MRPRRWGSGSAALVSDVAVTEKSDRFRACGTGFHCSSLVGSSFVSPCGAFSFSLPFQPLPGACHGGVMGSYSLLMGTGVHLSSQQEHPWLDVAATLGGDGKGG